MIYASRGSHCPPVRHPEVRAKLPHPRGVIPLNSSAESGRFPRSVHGIGFLRSLVRGVHQSRALVDFPRPMATRSSSSQRPILARPAT